MGKFTISMAIFNSYVKLPEGNFRMGKAWTIIQPLVAMTAQLGLADDHLPARPGQRTSTKPP
jgi:hypothetical protein